MGYHWDHLVVYFCVFGGIVSSMGESRGATYDRKRYRKGEQPAIEIFVDMFLTTYLQDIFANGSGKHYVPNPSSA